jgi:single-strand DNA-binding protein
MRHAARRVVGRASIGRRRERPEKSYVASRMRPVARTRAAILHFFLPDPGWIHEGRRMARGINKVILVGNLGNDPDVKYTQGGMAITTLSLATTTVRKDRDGNPQEKTEWHRVKLFGKLGEIAGEYLRKGRQVYIEGRLEYGSYEKDGVKHYTTDIVGDEMQMLGGGGGERGEAGDRGPRQQPAQRREPSGQSRQAPPAQNFGDDFADDDIPF